MFRFAFPLLAFCVSLSARAEDPFAVVANNLYYGGHDCTAIQDAHVAKVQGRSCTKAFAVEETFTPLDTMKRVTFENARTLAEGKNKCLADYGTAFVQSEKAQTEYRRKLTALWLNRKKAQLILGECQKIYAATPYPDTSLDARPDGQLTAEQLEKESATLKKFNPDLNLRYYATCRARNQVSALRALVELSDQAAPFLSSPEVFDLLEKNRGMVVSVQTGKPVTDAEILDFDLKGAAPLVAPDSAKLKGFFDDLKNYVRAQGQKRDTFVKSLSGKFAEKKLKELFNEGSAQETMSDLGYGEARAKEDPDVARVHFCLRSIYEGNEAVDFAEIIGLFLLARRVMPAGAVATMSRAGAWIPDSVAWVAAASPSIYRACRALQGEKEQLGGRPSSDPKMNVGALPNEFDFDLLSLETIPLESVESCKSLGMTRVFQKKNLKTSCAMEIAFAAIPVGVGKPSNAIRATLTR